VSAASKSNGNAAGTGAGTAKRALFGSQQRQDEDLVDNKEWEADYYDLKLRYFSTLDANEKSMKVRPATS
jgi:predicted DNA-binding helix-hairpin-helix protein